PANLKFGPVASCSVEFQETCLEIEFLFVDGPGTGETKRVDPTLQFEKRADVLAVMKIEVRHVPLVEVPIHERLLSPIVIAYLLPHVSDLATDCHVPIFSVAAQRDVFDRIPEILTKARIAQKGPVLIFPQQFVSAIRRLLLRSTLGVCLCGWHEQKESESPDCKGSLIHVPQAHHCSHRTSSGRALLLNRVNLGDIASGKFHDGGFPLIGLIWSNEDCRARTFRFCQSDLEICHLVSGHFPSIWIGKMTIRDDGRQVPKI